VSEAAALVLGAVGGAVLMGGCLLARLLGVRLVELLP
jgi:hypothetical protein